MLPDGVLSTTAVVTGYPDPVKQPGDLLIDWERAGVYLNDPSQGLMVKVWTLRGIPNPDTLEVDVVISAPGGVDPGEPSRVLFSGADITEVALGFDQNMNPFVAYVQAGQAKFWWYDSVSTGMIFTDLPAGARTPRATIDDKRPFNIANSDNILAYMLGSDLIVRYQRERYQIEHVMDTLGPEAELLSVAMNTQNRLQFRVRFAEVNAEDPRYKVQASPFLADIVQDLLGRSGVDRGDVDVTDLYTETLGYKCASQAGADSYIQPLRQGFFFDVSEYDKKIRFPKRGGPAVAALTVDDYLETDGSPLNLERVQEAELLRKVNLTYIDPAASYGPMTQAAERRSNTVLAKAEANSELPITMSADEAATVATRRLKVAWGELHKGDFDVGVPWSRLTPADVIEVTDKRGVRFRMRVLSIIEDSGQFSVEAIEDADWAYLSTAKGVTPVPPQSTTPGLVGDTQIVIMNLPALRGVDNVPGVYIAGYGTGSGWVGVEYWLSADGGQTYQPIGGIDIPANIGQTNGAQAASADPLNVRMLSGELSSATSAQLAARQNAIAIGSGGVFEIAQFENATETATDQYTLDTIAYNLLGTTASAHAEGDPVVLLDDAVAFCPIDRAFAGQTLLIKPVSFGQTLDEVTAVSFTYNPIINPPLFYRRDDILAVGGETTVTMDKAPTGLQILVNGILLTSGYTLSGNVATLATPATAGDEYTIIYFSEENPAATTLT